MRGFQELMGFEEAYLFVMKWEGGERFTQDPDDPGGATKYGVSYRFLKGLPLRDADVNRDGRVTWRDVAAMKESDAQRIYRNYFWRRLRLDDVVRLVEPLGLVLFDTAVNVGRLRAGRWLQEELNRRTRGLGHWDGALALDGLVGPKTLERLEEAKVSGNAFYLTEALLLRRTRHYTKLAARRNWARKYLLGWLNRTMNLQEATS